VKAVPQTCIQYIQIGLNIILMRILLLVESFDLLPSNQYILVRVIPSCFRFPKMSRHGEPEILDIFFLEEEEEVTLRLTVSQSVCLGIEHPCGTCDQTLLPLGMLLSEI
jgi:hypothetical protein